MSSSSAQSVRIPLTLDDVRPMALYDARQAAEIIGISRDAVYDIPEQELASTRVGPRRGKKKFYGWSIQRYVEAGATK